MSWLKVLVKTATLAALGSILIKISEQGQIKGTANVIKGDVIEIDGQKIKLYGIDALELEQLCYIKSRPWHCGLAAKKQLAEKIEGKSLTCITKDTKQDNIPEAECFVAGKNLNAWLVGQGWAIADRKKSRDFISDEILAQRNLNGIYQSEFLKPSLWREINQPELTLNSEPSILNHQPSNY